MAEERRSSITLLPGLASPLPDLHRHTHDVHRVVPRSQRTDGMSKMEVGVALIFNARKLEADRKLSYNPSTYSIKTVMQTSEEIILM